MRLLLLVYSLVIKADDEKAVAVTGFGEGDVLRFKTTLKPRCEGWFSVVTRKKTGARSRILALMKVQYNTRNNQITIYENLTGQWRQLAQTGNNMALYSANKDNSFVVRPYNCFNGQCSIDLRINGKKMTSKLFPGIGGLKFDMQHLANVFIIKAKTCGYIRVFRISKNNKRVADKAVLFEQLNMPNCGRSYELTNEELGALPADLRKRVRSGSEVDHLNQCENILRSLKSAGKRIVGGVDAAPGSHPWIASILEEPACSSISTAHTCGGTLINSEWVLTAAHCFPGGDYDYKIVKLGDYFNRGVSSFFKRRRCNANVAMLEENKKYKSIEDENELRIKELHLHPHYKKDQGSTQNDIALIRLERKVKLSKFVQPICLPTRPRQFEEECCHVAGWGKTAANQDFDDLPEILQTTSLPTRSPGKCKQTDATPTNEQFCGGYTEKECKNDPEESCKDTCQGDSGGPFICKEPSGSLDDKDKLDNSYTSIERAVLWGITSYGTRTCSSVGVYTKVYEHMDWIRSKIQYI